MAVIATAGHVDHGKSTLVRALTGTDPDRLAEEKARGLTIDLGFASLDLASGRRLSFVDVPGHVRFIKNMLAGVGAVDGCLFVVSAVEGWKPQSEEHLRILELLDLRRGVVALTMVGRTEPAQVSERLAQVSDHLSGTFLATAPLLPVDAVEGEGLDQVRAGLDDLAAAVADGPVAPGGRPRLWIDRSFTLRGAGTVVTGTLTGGAIRAGDRLDLVPGVGAGGRPLAVRVRGLQVHGRPVTEAGPRQRVAVNLTGAAVEQVRRGQALVERTRWHLATVVDASLRVLPSLDHDVGRSGAYRLHLGSGQQLVRVRVAGGRLAPGSAGWVRLHLSTPLPLAPGDRYVLREVGRAETVGGGEVLDVAPVLSVARARPDRRVERVVAERGWLDVAELERLTGARRHPSVGRWVVDPAVLATARQRLADRVARAGHRGLSAAALDERERAVVATLPGVTVAGDRVRPAGATELAAAAEAFLERCRQSPFAPPDPVRDGLPPDDLRALVAAGLLIECGDVWFAAEAVEAAAVVVADLLRGRPDGVSLSQLRQALDTSRRFALPLAGRLDATGVTRRRGDRRVAGPRLPTVSPGSAP